MGSLYSIPTFFFLFFSFSLSSSSSSSSSPPPPPPPPPPPQPPPPQPPPPQPHRAIWGSRVGFWFVKACHVTLRSVRSLNSLSFIIFVGFGTTNKLPVPENINIFGISRGGFVVCQGMPCHASKSSICKLICGFYYHFVGIGTTNKLPVPENMNIFGIIFLSCLGGCLLITIVVVTILLVKKCVSNGHKDYYEEEINMHEYNNNGFDPYEDDGFDPFEGTQEPTIKRPNSRSNGNITWVNSNYGFM